MAKYRFYNGGDRIYDRIPFDNPNNDIKTDNIVSYYLLEAPEQGFFEVADTIASGRSRSFTNFDLTIMSKWGTMGMVRVDPDIDPATSATPVARTDEAAKILGDQIHEEYLTKLCQDYINRVEERKANGLPVLPAQGYTRRALTKLNIADPALTVKNAVEKQKSGGDEDKRRIAQLESQIQAMQDQQTAFFASMMERLTVPVTGKGAKAAAAGD